LSSSSRPTIRPQNELLARFGLPTRITKVARDLLLELINRDKKVFGDAPRWILPSAIGRASVSSSITQADLIATLEALGEH
jgi:3-dehydroquinate synthetase